MTDPNAPAATLRIPDLGEGHGVSVIQVLVKPGVRVEVDTPLVTLESDKATMDVPATAAGTVASVLVNVGDKVDSVIALTGSLPVYDGRFERALAVGGRLFVVTGLGPVGGAASVPGPDRPNSCAKACSKRSWIRWSTPRSRRSSCSEAGPAGVANRPSADIVYYNTS